MCALAISFLKANEIIIKPNDSDFTGDVRDVIIKTNASSCNATINSLGEVEDTDCIRLINSKNIKILCTPNKKVCKTEKEVFNYLVTQLSSNEYNVPQQAKTNQDEFNVKETPAITKGKTNLNLNKLQNDCSSKDINSCNKLCSKGYGEACFTLGKLYADGSKKVVPNLMKSIEFTKKACDANHTTACANLGIFYFYGKGVNKNISRGVSLYEKSCNDGSSDGCMYLGFYYMNKKYGNRNVSKGIRLIGKACDSGNGPACFNLGQLYFKPGTTQDYSKAVMLYEKACHAGVAKGCYGLGFCYFDGLGVISNFNKAKELFKKACGGGVEQGCVMMRNLHQY